MFFFFSKLIIIIKSYVHGHKEEPMPMKMSVCRHTSRYTWMKSLKYDLFEIRNCFITIWRPSDIHCTITTTWSVMVSSAIRNNIIQSRSSTNELISSIVGFISYIEFYINFRETSAKWTNEKFLEIKNCSDSMVLPSGIYSW